MSLQLGKQLNRSYNLRIPFLEGYYNIGVFFNKRSPFLLFKIDPDLPMKNMIKKSAKIAMFKNLESSKFVETFLNLHNYKNQHLEILNQFHSIKSEYHFDVSIFLNETINLSKIKLNDKDIFDTLSIYGLNLTSRQNEFIFLIAERQNIITKLNKKIVRTSAMQISTTNSLELIDEFSIEKIKSEQLMKDITKVNNSDKIIKLSEIDKKLE